jgi:molybdate transport system substrate-binding protein
VGRAFLAALVAVLVAALVAGCGAIPGGERRELTIYAAASLRGAVADAASRYEAIAGNVDLAVATDSSATLATQITEGAPADVFLSADVRNAQRLVDAGFADGDLIAFARNELAIITPADDPGGVATPADLAKAGLRIIAAGDEVPITAYAAQLLENLAGLDGYPVDFAAAYAANVVSKEDNVAAIVAKIELVEGDAAIVYATDAVSVDAIATVDIPSEANVRATYAGIVVGGSEDPGIAHAFLDWLASPDGHAILSTYGFLPAPS